MNSLEKQAKQLLGVNMQTVLRAEVLQTYNEIKGRLGNYPDDIYWKPLAKITEAMKTKKNSPLLETGRMRDTERMEVGNLEGVVYTNDPIAYKMEYGDKSNNTPARPYHLPAYLVSTMRFKKKMNDILNIRP